MVQGIPTRKPFNELKVGDRFVHPDYNPDLIMEKTETGFKVTYNPGQPFPLHGAIKPTDVVTMVFQPRGE